MTLVFEILFYFFTASLALQLIYYWLVFGKLAFHRPQKYEGKTPPVSVIISAKNEYNNLEKNLPSILEQEYPDFEVVVVNDASDDGSDELLQDLSRDYGHLKVVNISQNLNFFTGKKFPLSLGIKSAKHDILLMTDADCTPGSRHWIESMSHNFTEGVDIVLGYGKYRRKKGFLNQLIRYDAFMVAVQYLSFALLGMPYMGVGRNLAYRKSLFYAHKGFISHYKIQSGDDDLFINRVAKRKNTSVEISHESHTISGPSPSFRTFIRQKRRHLTTARYYKTRFKLLLLVFAFSQLTFWALFIILLVFKYKILYLLAFFLIKLISQLFIIKKCMIKLNEEKILLTSPLDELIFILLNPVIAILNLIYKQDRWK